MVRLPTSSLLPRIAASLVFAGVIAVASSCGSRVQPPATQPVAVPVARVAPSNTSPLAPSFVRVEGSLPVDTARMGDPVQCSECHADAAAQWDSSAHHNASLSNPMYAAAVELTRHDRGEKASRWCAGCHDPSLLLDAKPQADGTLGSSWDRPDVGKSARAGDGVACLVCHSIQEGSRLGGAGYKIAVAPFVEPNVNDPASVAAHKSRMKPAPLSTPELCGSCHKVSIHDDVNTRRWLRGQDDFDAWEQGPYALGGSKTASVIYEPEVEAQRCQDCHMPNESVVRGDMAGRRVDGTAEKKLHSHRFLGGNGALAALMGDSDTARRESERLWGAVRVDIVALRRGGTPLTAEPMDDAPSVSADAQLSLDVVVENTSVGHRFPGGTADGDEVWLEVVVRDAMGEIVASNGTIDAEGALDPEAHKFGVLQLDGDGHPALHRDAHRFVAAGWDTTIGPKDARLVRYALDVTHDAKLPLRATARVLYRKMSADYARFACATTFASAPIRKGCGPAMVPIAEVGRSEVELGSPSRRVLDGAPSITRSRRLDVYARALLNGLQEEAGLAEPMATEALRISLDGSREQTAALIDLARTFVREGRTFDADTTLDRAQRIDPETPVIPLLRGLSRYEIYRLGDALDALKLVVDRAPKGLRGYELLGEALELAGSDSEAIDVVHRGLDIDPESAQLRHLEALAFDRLGGEVGGAPDRRVDATIARDAYLEYRADDDTPRLRAICRATVPGCAREATPIHVHMLTPPSHEAKSVAKAR